jgi:hypothetical protein
MSKRKVEKLFAFLLIYFGNMLKSILQILQLQEKKILHNVTTTRPTCAHFSPQKMSFASLAPPLFLVSRMFGPKKKKKEKKHTECCCWSTAPWFCCCQNFYPQSSQCAHYYTGKQEFEVETLPPENTKFVDFSWKQFQMHTPHDMITKWPASKQTLESKTN